MLLSRLFLLFLLCHVYAFGSVSKLVNFLKPVKAATPRYHLDVRRIVRETCNNFTQADMNSISEMYPNVQVTCVSEGSHLIPVTLWNDYDLQDENSTYYPEYDWTGDLQFIEVKTTSVSNSTRSQFPISACVRPTIKDGSGSFEVSLTMSTVLHLTGEIEGTLGQILDSGSISKTSGHETEFSYSLVCGYSDKAVRPMVEVSMVQVSEQTRIWDIELGRFLNINIGPWSSQQRTRLRENSLMLACVSERHQPKICHAYKNKALGRLDQYLIGPPEA